MYARAGSPRFRIPFLAGACLRLAFALSRRSLAQAWEIAYPRPFADVVEREAKKSGIPAALAYAVMREESAFDPEAVSPARASGSCSSSFPRREKVAKDVGITCDESASRVPRPMWHWDVAFWLTCARSSRLSALRDLGLQRRTGRALRWIASRESDDFDLLGRADSFRGNAKIHEEGLASYVAYSFLYERNGLDAALRLPKVVTQAGQPVASRARIVRAHARRLVAVEWPPSCRFRRALIRWSVRFSPHAIGCCVCWARRHGRGFRSPRSPRPRPLRDQGAPPRVCQERARARRGSTAEGEAALRGWSIPTSRAASGMRRPRTARRTSSWSCSMAPRSRRT